MKYKVGDLVRYRNKIDANEIGLVVSVGADEYAPNVWYEVMKGSKVIWRHELALHDIEDDI